MFYADWQRLNNPTDSKTNCALIHYFQKKKSSKVLIRLRVLNLHFKFSLERESFCYFFNPDLQKDSRRNLAIVYF